MWKLDGSIFEIVVRAFIIYAGLFILFRLVGKKQLGEMAPFDFVLVLIISESVSNALGAGENSITGGLISASTLILVNYIVDFFSYKSKSFEKLMDGEFKILIRDGKMDAKVCKSEKITKSELEEALRQLEIEKIEDVKIGFLETNGKISAFRK